MRFPSPFGKTQRPCRRVKHPIYNRPSAEILNVLQSIVADDAFRKASVLTGRIVGERAKVSPAAMSTAPRPALYYVKPFTRERAMRDEPDAPQPRLLDL